MERAALNVETSANLSEETRAHARATMLGSVDQSSMIVFKPANGQVKHTVTIFTDVDCGYCRQFLYELATAAALIILLPNAKPVSLSALLPDAFGPRNLGIDGGLMQAQNHQLVGDSRAVKGRAEHFRSARVFQTSTCSAIARASSTSMPRYLTVLSILVCPSRSWTALRLPVRR